MTIHIIYTLLLLGHVLGDFYLQSRFMADKKEGTSHINSTAVKKDDTNKYLFLHALIYMICMGVILVIGVSFSYNLVMLWLFVSLTHFCIDSIKKYIRVKPFIIDQMLHLSTLGIAWLLWGRNLQIREFALWESVYFPSKPILLIILGILLILQPVGILISKGEIWDFSKAKNKPSESQKGAGKMIGYLERIIVMFLLLNGQYSAVSFIIAAKSVARFPEISAQDGGALAEYYLIGTLLSMVSAFTVSILLGLIK